MTRHDQTLADVLSLEFAALREALTGPFDEFADGLKIKGARPVQLSRITSTNALLWGGNGRLLGWSLRVPSDGAAPGLVVLHNSHDGTGDILGQAAIPVGQTHSVWLGPGGVSFGEALSGEVFGPVVGVVYLRD